MTEETPEKTDEHDLLVIVVGPDGAGTMSVADSVDDTALGAWLHEMADKIIAGEHRAGCDSCAAGLPHDHTSEG